MGESRLLRRQYLLLLLFQCVRLKEGTIGRVMPQPHFYEIVSKDLGKVQNMQFRHLCLTVRWVYYCLYFKNLSPLQLFRNRFEQTKDQESTSVDKLYPYRGFRRDIVAVIGNCAYGRKNAQAENLLKGNAENENAVRDLEFQGSVTSTQIASLSFKVEVDLKSGRAKLINNL